MPHTYSKVYKLVFSHAVLLTSTLDAKVSLHYNLLPFHPVFTTKILCFRLLISVLLGLWSILGRRQKLLEHMLGWLQRYIAW